MRRRLILNWVLLRHLSYILIQSVSYVVRVAADQKCSGQSCKHLLVSNDGHRSDATLQFAKLYPPVQFIPIIFALVLVAAS
jgi:hypothetical protein